jgi:ElaB/YqjD/DUF883 family membrane-anchored ribosome-binding protein
MLVVTPSNSVAQKRDLHVGGLGSNGAAASSTVISPTIEAAGSWLYRGKNAVRNADDYVRMNPWTALTVVALAGLAAGLLLAQRTNR